MLVSTEMQRNSEWGVQLVSPPWVLCSFPPINLKIHSFLSSALNWLHLLFLSLTCELKKVYMCFFSIFTRHTILTFMNLPFNPILSFRKELQAQMGLSFGPFVCTERISSVHHGIFNVTSF